MRQAAIAAGIIHVKTPLERLAYWWKKADDDERAAFLANGGGLNMGTAVATNDGQSATLPIEEKLYTRWP